MRRTVVVAPSTVRHDEYREIDSVGRRRGGFIRRMRKGNRESFALRLARFGDERARVEGNASEEEFAPSLSAPSESELRLKLFLINANTPRSPSSRVGLASKERAEK